MRSCARRAVCSGPARVALALTEVFGMLQRLTGRISRRGVGEKRRDLSSGGGELSSSAGWIGDTDARDSPGDAESEGPAAELEARASVRSGL